MRENEGLKMKIRIYLIVLLINSFTLSAQFENSNLVFLDSTGDNMYDKFKLSQYSQVVFIDSLKGIRSLFFVVNEEGFIIQKTIDGGYNWESIFVDTLRFRDTTLDGKEFMSAPRVLKKFNFFKTGKIIIECSGGWSPAGHSRNKGCSIITSEDEGITWSEVKNDTLINMNYLYFNEKPIMWMEFVKESYEKPFLYHKFFASTDEGKSFEKIIIPEKLINIKFSDIIPVDENTVLFMFCDDKTDPFTYFPHFYKIKERNFEEYIIPKDLLTNRVFVDIQLRTIDDATIKVNRLFERDSITNKPKQWETFLVRTTDRWLTRDTILDMSIFTKYYKNSLLKKCVYFDSLNLIAYGSNYDLVKTSDGGRTWTHLSINEMTREQNDSLVYFNNNNTLALKIFGLTNFSGISWPNLKNCFVYCSDYIFSPGIIYKVDERLFGIEDNTPKVDENLFYPNPVTDFAQLRLDKEFSGFITISIVDLLGNTTQIYSGEVSGDSSLNHDFSSFPTGFYSLIIDYGTKREVVKVIKE